MPILTSHVYRLADLSNKSEYVLLPGEATMYVGSDFVGRMNLPLVAIGERYTVGFGVDPQLQVSRLMVKKSRSLQGGNQVHNYDYRITVASYKSESVKVQVWDRLPAGRGRSRRRQPARNHPQAQPGLGVPAQPAPGKPAAVGPDGRARSNRRKGGQPGLSIQARVRPRRGHRQFQDKSVIG